MRKRWRLIDELKTVATKVQARMAALVPGLELIELSTLKSGGEQREAEGAQKRKRSTPVEAEGGASGSGAADDDIRGRSNADRQNEKKRVAESDSEESIVPQEPNTDYQGESDEEGDEDDEGFVADGDGDEEDDDAEYLRSPPCAEMVANQTSVSDVLYGHDVAGTRLGSGSGHKRKREGSAGRGSLTEEEAAEAVVAVEEEGISKLQYRSY